MTQGQSQKEPKIFQYVTNIKIGVDKLILMFNKS